MKDKVRFQLISDYLDELQDIKELPPKTYTEKIEYFQEISNSTVTEWIDIYSEIDNMKPVGFLIMGYPPNCHPNANYYIEEAYIKPKHRRQHYMADTVANFIKTHPGTYCLFILNNNYIAKQFWFTLFARIGYIPCYLTDVGAGDKHCTQYGFNQPT